MRNERKPQGDFLFCHDKLIFPLQWLDLTTGVKRSDHRSGKIESLEWLGEKDKSKTGIGLDCLTCFYSTDDESPNYSFAKTNKDISHFIINYSH